MAIVDQLKGGTLSLKGNQGPVFETEGQRTTSNIQALASNNALKSSQDLISGRRYGKGRFTTFVSPSALDASGLPVGNVYKNSGPREGRY
jgi:hypothetical protein